jgi:Holliday junction resolvase RusA-like endonuclease
VPPEQLTLPKLGPAPLVVGPVFLAFELRGPPFHNARHRSRLVIPKSAWVHAGRMSYIPKQNVKMIFVQQYPEPKSEAFKKTLAQVAVLFMRGRAPTENPVAMVMHVFRQIPESWSKRDKEAAAVGAILPGSKPDDDNYLRLRDAFRGIIWRDDSQCCDSRVIKRYDTSPALRIEVREFLPPCPSPPPT